MAFKSLGGSARNYLDTETGEIISRWEYHKRIAGKTFRQEAKERKQKDLKAVLAKPARGRKKAASDFEAEIRLQAAQDKADKERELRLVKAAQKANKKIRLKKIRPQLLVSGRRAARIPFSDYADFVELNKQMNEVKLPNGRRLIESYAIGVSGFDERVMPPSQIDATLFTLQSPRVKITKADLDLALEDFLSEKTYFVFSHFWIHLHFDKAYAEKRAKEKQMRNIPKQYRKRK